MANNYTETMFTSLAIREIQIKTALRFHLAPIRNAIIKNIKNNVVKDTGEKELLCTVGGNVN